MDLEDVRIADLVGIGKCVWHIWEILGVLMVYTNRITWFLSLMVRGMCNMVERRIRYVLLIDIRSN